MDILKSLSVKQRHAQNRYEILTDLDLLLTDSSRVNGAITSIRKKYNIPLSTLNNWRALTRGLAKSDWRLALLPGWARVGGRIKEIPRAAWDAFLVDFLRPEAPPLSECYRRVLRISKLRGWCIPSCRTFRRRLQREIPAAVIRSARSKSQK